MRTNKLRFAVLAASLAFVSAANAALMSGSFGTADVYGGGSASAGTLTMFPKVLMNGSEQGIFIGLALSDVTAYSGTISGIGTAPTIENITDYLSFASPDATYGGTGTTPVNRYEFNLATLQYLGGRGGHI